MKNIVFFTICLLVVSGCSNKIESIHKKTDAGNKMYLSCIPNKVDGNPDYDSDHEKMAVKALPYVLMSNNSYADENQFFITNWRLSGRYKANNGFFADVYEKTNLDGTPVKEVVIAFRGTEGIKDIVFGSMSSSQAESADELFLKISGKEKYKESKITVTGHSLGGALALHVSIKNDKVDAYVFNTSNYLHLSELPSCDNKNDNKRVLLHEDNEALDVVMDKWKKRQACFFEKPIDPYNFLKNSNLIEHSIYIFARGMLRLAASTRDEYAINVININVNCDFD